jgi:hypothetical protein
MKILTVKESLVSSAFLSIPQSCRLRCDGLIGRLIVPLILAVAPYHIVWPPRPVHASLSGKADFFAAL